MSAAIVGGMDGGMFVWSCARVFGIANRGARGRIFEGEIIMTMTKTTFL